MQQPLMLPNMVCEFSSVQWFRQLTDQGYRDAIRPSRCRSKVQVSMMRGRAGSASVDAVRAAGIPVRFRATVLDTASNADGLCTV